MDSANVAFSAGQLLGQNGGAIGLAFGAGATAGWSFAIRTAFRSVKKQLEKLEENHVEERKLMRDALSRERADCERRIEDIQAHNTRIHDECTRRIAHLEAWMKEENERHMTQMERQLAQVRDSSERLTGRVYKGRIKRDEDDRG